MATSDWSQWDEAIDNSSSDKEELYNTAKREMENQESADAAWRLTKVCVYLAKTAERKNEDEEMKQKSLEALESGKKAVDLDSDKPECRRWYLAAIGQANDYLDTTDRVKLVFTFKENADALLEMQPDDFFTQFMYGRWCYEMSSLSWIERATARTIYQELPSSSYEDAMEHFKKSYKLNSKWKENMLWIAKTYIALNEMDEANDWIERGLALPIKDDTDHLAHQHLTELKSQD